MAAERPATTSPGPLEPRFLACALPRVWRAASRTSRGNDASGTCPLTRIGDTLATTAPSELLATSIRRPHLLHLYRPGLGISTLRPQPHLTLIT
jgi:hypothetical protein